ncbi:MAG: formyltransferase family protein [Burkholderiaceae bacterium]
MKKILFCIQNSLVEEVLIENEVINSNSIILRDKDELNLDFLEEVKPKLIMFPHWSYRVPKEIFTKYNCICFHSTPLPYGRGGSPIQNMIIRGHKKTEVCSLKMVEDFDAGPVFYRTEVSLEGTLHQILKSVYEAIADQVKKFLVEEIIPKKQEGDVVTFQRLGEADNEIDFNQPVKNIYDKVRMLDSPLYPKAYKKIGNSILEFSEAALEAQSLRLTVNLKKNTD